jgi:lipocalin
MTRHLEEPVHTGCALASLPLARNVDASDMTGTWYAVARLRGSNTLDATTIRINTATPKSFSLLYTGAK